MRVSTNMSLSLILSPPLSPINDIDNFTFINNEIKRRLTEKKIRYYRQLAPSPTINDQVPR